MMDLFISLLQLLAFAPRRPGYTTMWNALSTATEVHSHRARPTSTQPCIHEPPSVPCSPSENHAKQFMHSRDVPF